MLLLLFSLFSNYELHSCANYENAKFDESLLLKQHHQNYLQVNAFIREAEHRFQKEKSALREGDDKHETIRDLEYQHNSITNRMDHTSSTHQLGLIALQIPFLLRTQPSDPISPTPYSADLNERHLHWFDFFPDRNAFTTKDEPTLRADAEVSSTTKSLSFPHLPPSYLKYFESKFKSLIQKQKSITTTPTPRSNTTLKDHSGQGFVPNNTIMQPLEYQEKWLHRISTHIPSEKWFESMIATMVGTTTSHDFTTKPQGTPLPNTPTKDEDFGRPTANTTTTKHLIEEVYEIYLGNGSKTDEGTTMIDGKQVNVTMEADMKATLTTAGHVEPDPATQKPESTTIKTRRFLHSYKRHKARQGHQIHRYRYPESSYEDIYRRQREVEYPMLRRNKKTTENHKRFDVYMPDHHFKSMKKVVRRMESKKHVQDPTHPPDEMSQLSDHDDMENEELIKLIETQDEKEDEISLLQQVKQTFKETESKKKAKRLKLKAELLKKIVESSSYSDEEASLRKNLNIALQYVNRTSERDAAPTNNK